MAFCRHELIEIANGHSTTWTIKQQRMQQVQRDEVKTQADSQI